MHARALALPLLAVGLVLALPAGSALALEDLATILPADTAIYARARSLDALLSEISSSKNLASGRVLRSLYEEQIGGGLSEIAEGSGVELETWQGILSSITGVHFALIDAGRDEADLDAILAVELSKPDLVRGVLEKLLSEQAVFAGEVAGARVMSVDVEEDVSIFYALHEGWLFATMRPERMSALLEGRRKAPEQSLANQPPYRVGALPGGEGATMVAFADVQKGLGILMKTLGQYEIREFNQVNEIIHLDEIYTASIVSGGGQTQGRVTYKPSHAWLAAIRGTPGPAALQAFVPRDSLFFAVDSGSIDKKFTAITQLLTNEKSFPEAAKVKKGLGQVAEMLGFSLGELTKALGAEWMVVFPYVDEGTRLDDDAVVFAFEIKDRPKFESLMALLLSSPLAAEMERKGRGLVREPYAGYEILFEGREGRTSVPCLAIVEDVLLVSGDTRGIKAAIDAKTKGPTLTGAAGSFLAALPRTSSKLFVMDLASLLGMESGFTPLLDLLADGAVIAATADETPGRIDVRVNQSVAEFVGLLAGGELFRERYRNEENACLGNLRAIGVALKKYRDEKGESPPSLEALAGTLLPKARLVCPFDKGDKEMKCSYEYTFETSINENWWLDAWCPHRLHRRLVLYGNGNAWASSEASFRRQLHRQGIRPR